MRSHRAAPPPLPRAISASSYADCWPLAPWEPEFLNSPPSVWDLEGTHQEAPAAAASGAGVRSSRSQRPPSCSARNDRGASRARSRGGRGAPGPLPSRPGFTECGCAGIHLVRGCAHTQAAADSRPGPQGRRLLQGQAPLRPFPLRDWLSGRGRSGWLWRKWAGPSFKPT